MGFVRELRAIGETLLAIALTWLLLGWYFDRSFAQADATITWIPYIKSALAGGFDWTHHLYRFGVVGGSDMHASGGTLPLVQLCALGGLGATTTANVLTIFLQLCFGFFGALLAEGIAKRPLTTPERIACVWLCAFAPVLGWRLAFGHENLLLGLLPYVVAIALLHGRAGPLAIVLGAFAVANGVSGLGPQMLVYGAVFGGPAAVVAWLGATRGARFVAIAVVVGGVLLVLPRLVVMYAHQLGGDAGRGLASSLTYSYGEQTAGDWLGSIPWTTKLAPAGGIPLHERNFPLGPLVCFAVLGWPRRLALAMLGGAVVAILFACEVPPFSLLAHVPVIESFRVPARAIVPILVLVAPLAIGALLRRSEPAGRVAWIALGAGAVLIALGHGEVPLAREVVAWLVAVALVVLARRQQRVQLLAPGLALLGVLSVLAFDERFPRRVAYDPIERGPADVRDAVLSSAPELAMPLERVQITDAPAPYEMSTAFAAGLPSLDGAWFPPRRFLVLLGALVGKPIPPETGVFKLTHSTAFPVLQQLYNVRYLVSVKGSGTLEQLPPTPGAAWFPSKIEVVEDAEAAGRAMLKRRGELATTAWALHDDRSPPPGDPRCANAKVDNIATDELGQTATFAVTSPAICTLVVATTYSSTLHANAPVFPIDVALVGIAVTPGTSTIVLGPDTQIPLWSRIGQLIGLGLLAAAITRAASLRPGDPRPYRSRASRADSAASES